MAWKPKYPESPRQMGFWFRLKHATRERAGVAVPSAIFGAALCWATLCFISWHPLQVVKHIAAFPNCAAARAVGLAPAYRGQPGYWPKLDADNDGISCEVWPRRIR